MASSPTSKPENEFSLFQVIDTFDRFILQNVRPGEQKLSEMVWKNIVCKYYQHFCYIDLHLQGEMNKVCR